MTYDSSSTVYSAPVSVTVAAGTAPKLQISVVTVNSTNLSGIVLPPQRSISLSATGLPGQTYDVAWSQDSKTWTLIGTLTLECCTDRGRL